MGTMSGFICARYTIAHLIKQINHQGKLNGGEEKSKVMHDKTGHDYSQARTTTGTKRKCTITYIK